ncbi:hypothetical protein [Paludisphaera borealis]|uniref:Uncharacterized protein n=1 Tax=Paludisphaera borealis TaxID=1387353 RepID=A0A1U7CXZ8_9BACT|nr:hypothetical protein [Paludisphaera borealis]APW63791.1 hypothetical protein BSF38_05368 [Paludisphaera borealis]
MYFLVPVTLIAWIPFCLVLFAVIPRRQAVVIGIIAAWLFLPPSGISIAGLPDYGKGSAFSYGILLGTLLFMPDRILQFRPHWLDVMMICHCVCPMASSLTNGLGAYDGTSGCVASVITWAFPYLVGRIHFNDERSLRDLLIGIVVGGLVYVPFCLYEMRMSPTLLTTVYGIGGFSGERLGGWRPRVFFPDGLELGMWMSISSLSAVWLWQRRVLTSMAGYSFGSFILPVLLIITVLCRSSGALLLLMTGLAILWLSVRFNSRLLMLSLLSVPILYVAIRVPNLWDYGGLVSFLTNNFSPARAQSLEFRFQNEDILINKAVQQPIFGWAGWGRSRVFDANGKDISITDGLWIILLGQGGMVGLASFLAIFLLPALVFLGRYQPKRWAEPALAAQSAVVCIIGIYMIDCLLNGFVNSVYVVALGGLVSCLQRGPASDAAHTLRGVGGGNGIGDDCDGDVRPLGGGRREGGLADRYIELARNSRRSGSYKNAGSAWRCAYELLVSQSAADDDAELSRRRFDCANDLAWFLLSRPDPEPGDRVEAVDLARQATQANPENPTYWNTLAAALCRVGDDQAAIDSIERGLALNAAPSSFDFAVLALAHARLGRREQAAQWLAEAREWRKRSQVASTLLDELIEESQTALAS